MWMITDMYTLVVWSRSMAAPMPWTRAVQRRSMHLLHVVCNVVNKGCGQFRHLQRQQLISVIVGF